METTAPRKRARQACSSCNSRKVKCDVTVVGIPCTNCQRDATLTCETVKRKVHRSRRSDLVAPAALLPSALATNSAHPAPIEAEDINGLPDDNSLSFLGDRHGPRNYVYELCLPGTPQDARQTTSRPHWKAHHLDYLRAEQAFTPFSDDMTNALITCYFEHMHFLFPVLDVAMFFRDCLRQEDRCWLLYWAVMLAGANFVGPDELREAGFVSRKDLKRAIYTKAKCLYDFDLGSDKLVLIQATTLLSFWYSDAQDHTGAWYWIGCAVSLAQTIGLHRAAPSAAHHSSRNEPLVRRIWWTLVIRDRWLSLAKGRPMRINEDDCDISLPDSTDVMDELYQLPPELAARFLPMNFNLLAGRILKAHYGIHPRSPATALVDIAKHRSELLACKPMDYEDGSRSVELHACHMELFYQMAMIVLYRPYVLESILDDVSTVDAWQQARGAASSMSTTLERIMRLDGVDLLKPMAITALVPAMQIHLSDCRSSNQAMRALGQNKLELYLYVLAQLQKTYWSANVIHRLFSRALAIVQQNAVPPPLVSVESGQSVPQIPDTTQDQFNIDQLFAMDFDLFNVDAWFPTEPPVNQETIGNSSSDFSFW